MSKIEKNKLKVENKTFTSFIASENNFNKHNETSIDKDTTNKLLQDQFLNNYLNDLQYMNPSIMLFWKEIVNKIIIPFKIFDSTKVLNLFKVIYKTKSHLKIYPSYGKDIRVSYSTTNVKDRMIEILQIVGNHVISTNTELLSADVERTFNMKHNTNNYKLFSRLLKTNVIELRELPSKKDRTHNKIVYYRIIGQYDPHSTEQSYSESKEALILNTLAKYPNGLTKTQSIKLSGGELEKDSIFESSFTKLVDKNVIFFNVTSKKYYIPTLEERIFTELLYPNIDPLKDRYKIINKIYPILNILENIGLNQFTKPLMLEKDSKEEDKVNYVEHTPNFMFIRYYNLALNNLSEKKLLEYDQDNNTYIVKKPIFNKYFGLESDQLNNKPTYKKTDLIRLKLLQKYANFTIAIDILRYLWQNYNQDKLIPLTDIYTYLRPNNPRSINATVRTYSKKFLHDGLINKYYIILEKIDKSGNSTTKCYTNYIELNPNNLAYVEYLLLYVTNRSNFEQGFGRHEYHLLPNFIIKVIIDYWEELIKFSENNQEKYFNALIHYLELIPDVQTMYEGVLASNSSNNNFTIAEMVNYYIKKQPISNNESFFTEFLSNILKSGAQTNSLFSYKTGVIFIDFREFLMNSSNGKETIENFISLLSYNNPTERSTLQNKFLSTSPLFIDKNSSEDDLAHYMQTFWSIFATYLYKKNAIELFSTLNIILNYIDGSITLKDGIIVRDSNGILIDNNKKSENTKFYEYLINDISLNSDKTDILVPSYKKDLIDVLISSITTGTMNSKTVLGHPMSPADKTGASAISGKLIRLGGHSDVAYRYPLDWSNSSKLVERIYGNITWRVQDLAGSADVEFKRADTLSYMGMHAIGESQFNYFIGQPAPKYAPNSEMKLKFEIENYIPKTNDLITFEMINIYLNKSFKIKSDLFIKFTNDLLKIHSGYNKSFVSYSNPIPIKQNKNSASNTVVVNILKLNTFKSIFAINKIFSDLNTNMLSLQNDTKELVQFFKIIGLDIEIDLLENSMIIKQVDKKILELINQEIKYPKSELVQKYIERLSS